jgi:hypothetical protein
MPPGGATRRCCSQPGAPALSFDMLDVVQIVRPEGDALLGPFIDLELKDIRPGIATPIELVA